MNNLYPKIYMAYGSNLNIRQMSRRCRWAEVYGTATLPDYQLLFRGSGAAVATIEPKQGSSVPVALWKVTAPDEAALDRYEGWPHLYRKEVVRVRVGRRWVNAFVYIMNGNLPLGRPCPSYLYTITEGYDDFGFDRAVLEEAVRASGLAGK